MKQILFWIWICVVVISTSACTTARAVTPTQEASLVPPETQVSTDVKSTQTQITEEPTRTVTRFPNVPQSVESPTPTLSSLVGSSFALRSLVFEGEIGCTLPCWHSVVPGESTEAEVNSVIQSTFGIDLSEVQPYGFQITPATKTDLTTTYFMKSYAWHIPNAKGESPPDGDFYLTTGLSESNRVLEILQMKWLTASSSRFKIELSMLGVIRELGSPSHILVRPETYGSADFGGIGFLLLYPQGTVFQFTYNDMIFKTTPANDSAIRNTHIDICLDVTETVPQTNIGYIMGDVFLVQPFSVDLSDLTPIQASVITDLIEVNKYEPVEQVFGMSTESITAQAAAGQDVCLSTIIQ